MSVFRSRDDGQNDSVADLHAQAAEDYSKHQDPATGAAAREQAGQARTNGNEAAASAGGRWGR
jgi:hypothetical protein